MTTFPPGALHRARPGRGVRALRPGRRADLPGLGHRQLRAGRARHVARPTSRSSSCSEKHGLADRRSASPAGSSPRSPSRWCSSSSCCACSPTAAPIMRLISTLGLLVVVQSAVELRYGKANHPVERVPARTTRSTGAACVCRSRCSTSSGSPCVRHLRALGVRQVQRAIGLAITAAAQNERAVQTMGWSPNRLSAITWGMGAALAGLAGVLLAPLTGLSTIDLHADRDRHRDGRRAARRLPVVPAHAARRVRHRDRRGGRRPLPLRHRGLPRRRASSPASSAPIPFLLILLVLVVRGRGLPLRSHVTDRLPEARHRADQRAGPALGDRRSLSFLLETADGRPVGGRDLHLDHPADRRPVDRRAHRLRRPALARAVGARGHAAR